MEKEKKNIDRRNFLKTLGAGVAVTGGALYGFTPDIKAANTTSSSKLSGEVPTNKMTYRTNPHSGDHVSLLGYGCMRWPFRQKPGSKEEEPDQETINRLVDYAIEHGVNYFDTAPVYMRGLSEACAGIALKRHPRDKFLIATKLSNMRDFSFEQSKEMYLQSFKNLQVDHIDYYLLHSLGSVENCKKRFIDNGMVDFLVKERKAGRIRNLGWSFHGEVEAFDYMLAQDIQWDFAQIQLNYIDWKNADTSWNVNAEYLYDELVKHNVPAVIMEPLLGGRLANLPYHSLKLLKEMDINATPAEWAFRYAGTPEHVLTVLSGMVYMEHLQENIRTYSPLEPVNAEEDKVLQKIALQMKNSDFIPCTTCQYCMPCPYGIDIPSVFSHYNKCVNDNLLPKDAQDPNYREARRAFLVGYDRQVPKLRQASHCIGCDVCRSKCPQRINIPQEMSRIDVFTNKLRTEIY
ncbi:MAG: aldo/keto reductase [Culturomica sp.]|jgi:predicted aldo/keto reductase-like oxidoreductase|nr:aldo/keto reductase [Culturomica sp.]